MASGKAKSVGLGAMGHVFFFVCLGPMMALCPVHVQKGADGGRAPRRRDSVRTGQ